MSDAGQAATEVLLGRDAVTDWLRQRMLALPTRPALRQVWMCDQDFADWPLAEPSVEHALGQWLRLPGRHIGLVAHDFDALVRHQPRFARWRRDWVHRIQAWQPEDTATAWPRVGWLDEQAALCWQSRSAWRGHAEHVGAAVTHSRQELDAFLQRCVSAWPAKTLGL